MPERLDEGSPEERATFGLFTILTPHGSLAEGYDSYLGGYRNGPLVSGYHVAEWFSWNWWRLCCEPRSASADWGFAHKMTSIGEGYSWPNITIFSDGVRTALISKASSGPESSSFRYVGALPLIVPTTVFETAVDAFVPQIIGKLERNGLTNLHRLWADVLAERKDPEIIKRRTLEALLGQDPDTSDNTEIERLLADAASLGEAAINEIAADRAQAGQHAKQIFSAASFKDLANTHGCDTSPKDAVRLTERIFATGAEVPAWKVGAEAAKALRKQESFNLEPIGDAGLLDLAAVERKALDDVPDIKEMSFVLEINPTNAKMVLRSKWKTGRRFDIARLIGDRLLDGRGALHPATRAATYRQKAQRSFAAELLSPFQAVEKMLAGDFSQEAQQDVADYFDVSPMTINNILKNHGRIPREEVDPDFDAIGSPN